VLVSATETRPVWLLVRTKPRKERLAADSLAGRGIRVYCPRILEPRTHSRASLGPTPLFPSYVFGNCVIERSFHALAYCPGVSGPVRFGERLAAVDDADVAYLQENERERGYVVASTVRTPPVEGSRVRIVGGPFCGMQGLVEHYLPSQSRVRLLLEAVTGRWRCQMRAEDVRVA
jgi:transcription antitermination factor NusG